MQEQVSRHPSGEQRGERGLRSGLKDAGKSHACPLGSGFFGFTGLSHPTNPPQWVTKDTPPGPWEMQWLRLLGDTETVPRRPKSNAEPCTCVWCIPRPLSGISGTGFMIPQHQTAKGLRGAGKGVDAVKPRLALPAQVYPWLPHDRPSAKFREHDAAEHIHAHTQTHRSTQETALMMHAWLTHVGKRPDRCEIRITNTCRAPDGSLGESSCYERTEGKQ